MCQHIYSSTYKTGAAKLHYLFILTGYAMTFGVVRDKRPVGHIIFKEMRS